LKQISANYEADPFEMVKKAAAQRLSQKDSGAAKICECLRRLTFRGGWLMVLLSSFFERN
jgi:hypothetical protein